MRILVGCEESQRVCKAFRAKGHKAYSCDLRSCSGGKPEWHIQGDILDQLDKGWDMLIAFPPCTYLSFAGVGYFNIRKYGEKALLRRKLRYEAICFFLELLDCDIPKICIENPRGYIMHKVKQSQIIQPWMFGDRANKPTCLWLKNLPLLRPTKIVDQGEMNYHINSKGRVHRNSAWLDKVYRYEDRQVSRSKTFPGIARAMANQWSNTSFTNNWKDRIKFLEKIKNR